MGKEFFLIYTPALPRVLRLAEMRNPC